MLMRPMMLRAAGAVAAAKYTENFNTAGGPNQGGDGTIPAGWQASQGTSDGTYYGQLDQITTSPFEGARCLRATGNGSYASVITRQYDLTGCTQLKLRIAGTSVSDINSRSPVLNAGGAALPSTGLVSATNTGKTAPTGTWWEFLFNLPSPTSTSSVNIGSNGGSASYFDLLEIF